MKNRLFYAEFGDADAAPAAAADENSRKKVSDAFRVSFDNSQKKFFGLVRDGIFALLALVLFALSFAPVYGIRSSAYSPEYTTVDIVGMMFDLTADWDDEKYYEEYRDAREEFSEKYDEARKAGNYAEMRRLADRWRIEETRLLLRLERTDIPIGTFVVAGLIGLFFIVFAFLLAAVYVTAFVRTLLGKERIPAFLASRKLFAACGGCHGALFPAYLFYMVLFLLAVLQFGTITTYFVAGSMAAALAFASLGTLIFLADAFTSFDRAAKKRIWSGITVFALSLTAVGVMFTPALTMRINDYRGTASSTLLRNLDFSDEDWAVLEESVLSLTYEEKQAYVENLLREQLVFARRNGRYDCTAAYNLRLRPYVGRTCGGLLFLPVCRGGVWCGGCRGARGRSVGERYADKVADGVSRDGTGEPAGIPRLLCRGRRHLQRHDRPSVSALRAGQKRLSFHNNGR